MVYFERNHVLYFQLKNEFEGLPGVNKNPVVKIKNTSGWWTVGFSFCSAKKSVFAGDLFF